jgi:hypothetical protein
LTAYTRAHKSRSVDSLAYAESERRNEELGEHAARLALGAFAGHGKLVSDGFPVLHVATPPQAKSIYEQ